MKKIYFLLLASFMIGVTNAQTLSATDTRTANTSSAVSLSDFTAVKTSNGVEFNWVATTENNISRHEIEKSSNGSDFRSIGVVLAQNDAHSYRYTYTDGTPAESYNYYRLRTTDNYGKVIYSSILKVDNSYRKADFAIVPNPVKNGVLNMQLSNFEAGKYNITLYNNAGLAVFARSFDYTAGSSTETVYLPATLSRGLYFLQINNSSARMNRQVMIQ